MLEKEIEAKVVDYAKSLGILTYKFVSPNNRGVPDRIFLYSGRTLFIEFKQMKGKPTALQMREHDRLRDAGHTVYFVNSVDLGKFVIDDFFMFDLP